MLAAQTYQNLTFVSAIGIITIFFYVQQMEQSKCQRCKESFNSSLKKPMKLPCSCVICLKCISTSLEFDEQFTCKEHRKVFNGQVSDLLDFIAVERFQKTILDFQQNAKINEDLIEFTQLFTSQQLKYSNFKKAIQVVQNFFSNIVSQVCQQETKIIYEQLQNSINQNAQIISSLKGQIQSFEQVFSLSSETAKEHEQREKLLKEVQDQYEQTQQLMISMRHQEVEDVNENKITEQLTEACYHVLRLIQVQTNSKLIQTQNMMNLVADNLSQNGFYYFETLSSKNIPKFVQKFQNQKLSSEKLIENPLNKTNICQNQEILRSLKQYQSQSFIQNLNEVIELSKTCKEVEQASANAITILKFLNPNFEQKNFEGIQISGADLSGAKLQNCNLSNSNLQEVNLKSVQLINCNLNGVNLTNAILESSQSLDNFQGHTNCVRSVVISSDQK